MRRSERKIQSARLNGAKSKGPKTPEGKRRSSYNAVRHGLLSKCTVLATEDPANFEALLQQFVARFEPLDDVEFGMVEEMASATWRMRRGWAVETELMNEAILRQKSDASDKDEDRALAAAFKQLAAEPVLGLLHRYETRLSRLYQRALRNLLSLREKKPSQLEEVSDPRPSESEDCETNPVTNSKLAADASGTPKRGPIAVPNASRRPNPQLPAPKNAPPRPREVAPR
jgi:hypothetical protein